MDSQKKATPKSFQVRGFPPGSADTESIQVNLRSIVSGKRCPVVTRASFTGRFLASVTRSRTMFYATCERSALCPEMIADAEPSGMITCLFKIYLKKPATTSPAGVLMDNQVAKSLAIPCMFL